ncbi:hypothetical protein DL93DRAFT_1054706 [Clavulina sp. PMI_390]|nr:hypothetical protein DL93DRAFT_1054706 [Clavulina sp. PMI_390]
MMMDDAQAPASTSGSSDGDSALPTFAPSQTTLKIANPREVLHVRKQTYKAWGKDRMSREQYLQVARELEKTSAATPVNYCTWILVPRDNPSGRTIILSSCETYGRASFAIRPRDNTTMDVDSYGIASVYTPEKHRKNGYARHMLRLLHYVLAPTNCLPPFPADLYGPPPVIGPTRVRLGAALFSVLYSDIGKDFYRSCGPTPQTSGWEVRDPWSVIWPVPEDFSVPTPPGFLQIPYDLLKGYLEVDRYKMRCDDFPGFARRGTNGPSNWAAIGNNRTVHVTVQPDISNMDFLATRWKASLPGGAPRDMPWGVYHSPLTRTTPDTSYAVWVPEPHENSTLLITRMRYENETVLESLLIAAMNQAKALGLKHVEVWNCLDRSRPVPLGGQWYERQNHLPAIAWYGLDVPKSDVVWDYNERYVPALQSSSPQLHHSSILAIEY